MGMRTMGSRRWRDDRLYTITKLGSWNDDYAMTMAAYSQVNDGITITTEWHVPHQISSSHLKTSSTTWKPVAILSPGLIWRQLSDESGMNTTGWRFWSGDDGIKTTAWRRMCDDDGARRRQHDNRMAKLQWRRWNDLDGARRRQYDSSMIAMGDVKLQMILAWRRLYQEYCMMTMAYVTTTAWRKSEYEAPNRTMRWPRQHRDTKHIPRGPITFYFAFSAKPSNKIVRAHV